jgi:iron(III) transport system permease protein
VEGSSTAFPVADLGAATLTTLGLAAAGAVLTTLLALPVAWVAVRRPGRLARLVERSSFIGSSLPGVVVALALVTVAIRALPAIYQTTALLLVAYAILFLPRTMVAIRAALAQVPPELDDAARSLGRRPAAVLARITLPLVARGLGAGSALVFLAVVTELTATLLLAPTGTATLATAFWQAGATLDYGTAAPYAVVMVLLSAPATVLLSRDPRRGLTT